MEVEYKLSRTYLGTYLLDNNGALSSALTLSSRNKSMLYILYNVPTPLPVQRGMNSREQRKKKRR